MKWPNSSEQQNVIHSKTNIGSFKYSHKNDPLCQGSLLRRGLKQRLRNYLGYEVGRMQDEGHGLQVIIESRPHFLTAFSVDFAHGEFLLVKL